MKGSSVSQCHFRLALNIGVGYVFSTICSRHQFHRPGLLPPETPFSPRKEDVWILPRHFRQNSYFNHSVIHRSQKIFEEHGVSSVPSAIVFYSKVPSLSSITHAGTRSTVSGILFFLSFINAFKIITRINAIRAIVIINYHSDIDELSLFPWFTLLYLQFWLVVLPTFVLLLGVG